MQTDIATRTLREWRKEKKMTQQELADSLGLTRQSVSRMERREVTPNIVQARIIARTLDVPLDAIDFGGEHDDQSD